MNQNPIKQPTFFEKALNLVKSPIIGFDYNYFNRQVTHPETEEILNKAAYESQEMIKRRGVGAAIGAALIGVSNIALVRVGVDADSLVGAVSSAAHPVGIGIWAAEAFKLVKESTYIASATIKLTNYIRNRVENRSETFAKISGIHAQAPKEVKDSYDTLMRIKEYYDPSVLTGVPSLRRKISDSGIPEGLVRIIQEAKIDETEIAWFVKDIHEAPDYDEHYTKEFVHKIGREYHRLKTIVSDYYGANWEDVDKLEDHIVNTMSGAE